MQIDCGFDRGQDLRHALAVPFEDKPREGLQVARPRPKGFKLFDGLVNQRGCSSPTFFHSQQATGNVNLPRLES